jgi:hypothetical protein
MIVLNCVSKQQAVTKIRIYYDVFKFVFVVYCGMSVLNYLICNKLS